MENMESVIVTRGTNPFLTVLLFGMIIAGIVTSGSYFSRQHVAAQEVGEGLKVPLNTFATIAAE
jgi:hypothetical protein